MHSRCLGALGFICRILKGCCLNEMFWIWWYESSIYISLNVLWLEFIAGYMKGCVMLKIGKELLLFQFLALPYILASYLIEECIMKLSHMRRNGMLYLYLLLDIQQQLLQRQLMLCTQWRYCVSTNCSSDEHIANSLDWFTCDHPLVLFLVFELLFSSKLFNAYKLVLVAVVFADGTKRSNK